MISGYMYTGYGEVRPSRIRYGRRPLTMIHQSVGLWIASAGVHYS